MSRCTDLFVEVTNVTKGNGIWAHFVSTGYFPSQIQLSRLIQKDDVQIETVCCICHATARQPPFPVNYVSWFPSELRGKAVPLTESLYSS